LFFPIDQIAFNILRGLPIHQGFAAEWDLPKYKVVAVKISKLIRVEQTL
jgi:hypothetical protein